MADNTFNRVRVGGSGFTVFHFLNQPIAFARQIAHTSPRPVGPGAVPIQPMDAAYPVQVITPEAAGMGTLTLELIELYGAQVWERLGANTVGSDGRAANSDAAGGTLFKQAVDIVDIFRRQAAANNPIHVIKYIKPPTLRGKTVPAYTEEYHNVVVTDVVDGETIEIGTMEVLKTVTLGYTHVTRNGRRGDTDKQTDVIEGATLRDSTTTSGV